MRSLRLALLLALGCSTTASAAPGDDPAPAPAPKVEPAPKEEPKVPAVPKTSPEARALLLEAAKKQGTEKLVGPLAPTRYRANFASIVIHGENRVEISDTVFSFALPEPGGKQARMRNEIAVDGKQTILGHNGSFGWMWTKDLETSVEQRKLFTDPDKDKADIEDIESRRRMLRLALRIFFLGDMAGSAVPVKLLPDEDAKIPFGREEKPRVVKCRVLERAADPAVGEPALRIYLDAATLDPVAVALLPPKEGEASFLLTLAFETPEVREKKRAKMPFPPGVRVPDWLELFEVPAGGKEPPALQIQADVSGFEIDPEKIPDSLFTAPRIGK